MNSQAAPRILAIANNVFREALREQALYLLLLFIGILMLSLSLLPELSAAGEKDIIPDVALAAIEWVGLVVVAFLGTNLVSREIDKRTILPLIAKPLRRADFIVGKLLGLMAVLVLLVMVMTGLCLLILPIGKVYLPIGPIFVSSSFLCLQFLLLGSFALFYSTFTSALLSTLLTFATYLVGHFSADLLQLGKLTQNPTTQQLTQALFLLLPDLSRTNLKNLAVYGELPPPDQLLQDGVYTLSYVLVMVSLAILIFAKRQF